jgi:hypothetical protein
MDCRFACGTFTKRRPKSTVTARKKLAEIEILSPADLQLNLAVQQHPVRAPNSFAANRDVGGEPICEV